MERWGIRLHLQLDDVWVSKQFEILDLPFDLPDNIETADPLPVQDLHSYFMACQLMLANCKQINTDMKQMQHTDKIT